MTSPSNNITHALRRIAAEMSGPIPKRQLGKTGLMVSQLGLGGGGGISLEDNEDQAQELIETALELGINYIDTAADYGPSEKRIGAVLGSSRADVVLATKTDDRTYKGAKKQLESSLRALKTDYIDIWQIHHIDHDEEVEQIFSKGGAMEAVEEAKRKGTVKFAGVTGHYDPRPLKKCLSLYDFDTILLAMNAADVHKNSFIKGVLPEAVKQDIGIVGMKVACLGRIFHSWLLNNMQDSLDYVLSLPVATAIIGVETQAQLYENVLCAKRFKPLTEDQMKELEDKTKSYAHLANFFRRGNEKYNPFWKAYPQKKGNVAGAIFL
ncbi:MAG: aldo/keto reductase [Candidatus Altiarchaeales archaeon]|nr:aldo/keto reductase [Candidatus Altiarchaeales archaeon]